MEKHSITIAGHRTSLSLETPFWQALKRIAQTEGVSLSTVVARIDNQRLGQNPNMGLSSAIRIFVLRHFWQEDPPTANR